MWKLSIASLTACCGSKLTPEEHRRATETLQAVDVPLEKWKRIAVDGRVMELLHGTHLDDVLKDTPEGVRPPTLIYFHDSTAKGQPNFATEQDFVKVAEDNAFGDRERLMIGKYDVGVAPKRVWFRITPERNLTHRFLRPRGDASLPKLVFLPRKCNGWTEWCDPGGPERIVGGDCYVEQCSDWTLVEPDAGGEWVSAVKGLMEKEGAPEVWHELNGFEEQAQWLRSRDTATTREHLELLQAPRSLPRFTKRGFRIMEVPKDMQDLLVQFYLERNHTGKDEPWNSWGQTQINTHEVTSKIVDIQAPDARETYYNRIVEWMKPRLEKWVGVSLEMTSLYGMREYFSPVTLRNHLDRPDVLVISVTFSVFQEGFDHRKWPLEVISFDGNTWRAEHPQGTMMYYESATLQHGKPSKLPEGGKHVGMFLHYRPTYWAHSDFVEFSHERSSKAVRVIRNDGRPRHQRQEGWPPYFDQTAADPSVFTDLQEGTYFTVGNLCGNSSDQRDDGARLLGTDRWSSDKPLGNALLEAAKSGKQTDVKTLLKDGADPNFKDQNFWRPLHEAARAGWLGVAQVLLEAGADPHARTHDSRTAYDLAREHHGEGRDDLLRLLSPSEL